MVFRRRTRRTFRRRPPIRRAGRRPVRRGGPKARSRGSNYRTRPGTSVFPPIKRQKFTYMEDLDLLPGTASFDTVSYRGNSLWDPSVAVGGHRPRYTATFLGADGSNAPYRRYQVNAVRADVFFRNQSSVHLMCAVTMCEQSVSAPVTWQEAKERPDTITRIISPIGSGPALGKLIMFRKTKNIVGVKDILDNHDLQAEHDNDPTRQTRVIVRVFNIDSGSSARIGVSTKLTYYSKLMNLTDVADS